MHKYILNEDIPHIDERVKQAINKVLRVKITYNDGKLPHKGRNSRYILPVAFGLTKSGKKAVRAFQTSGSTKRGVPKWKLFLLNNVVSWNNSSKSFENYKNDLIKLGLNLNGDKHMTTLFAITPFANSDIQVSKYANTIDPEPILKTDVTPTVNNQNYSNKNPKTEPNKNNIQTSIDFNPQKGYTQSSNNNLSTKPIFKSNILNTNNIDDDNIDNIENANITTNINVGDVKPVDNEPITKSDVEQPTDIKDNELTKKYNDLMSRMDKLNKDNNEEDLEYGN